MREIEEYSSRYENPFDFLLDARKTSALIDALLKSRDGQRGLFDYDGKEELSFLLEDMFNLGSSNRLYKIWSQVIDGKERELSVPNSSFDTFAKKYLVPFIKDARVHCASHGGEKGWSPRASVASHLPLERVLSFDLSSAFANCRIDEVRRFYLRALENSETEHKGDLAEFLSFISTVWYKDSRKRGIPQGASFGPALFNRVLYELDCELETMSGNRGLHYTRWIDDIIISSQEGVALERIAGAVEFVGKRLPIAPHKIYFQDAQCPVYLLGQVITGGRTHKNSREDREKNKSGKVDYDWLSSLNFERWN